MYDVVKYRNQIENSKITPESKEARKTEMVSEKNRFKRLNNHARSFSVGCGIRPNKHSNSLKINPGPRNNNGYSQRVIKDKLRNHFRFQGIIEVSQKRLTLL